MNLQHRNQAPRPQNRHRFDLERKSLKKPEAPGSAGRCEKGTGRSTAPSLCPASFSHPLYWLYSGIFQPCPHRAEFGFLGPGAGPFPHPGCETGTQGQTVANRGVPGPGCCWARKRLLPGFPWQRSCVFVMGFAGNLPILPHPPARRGISAAGNPPAPW